MTVIKDSLTLTGSESERMLSTLLGNLPGMAYRCRNDEQWTMEFASAGCFELTGYEPQDLIDNKRISYADLIDEEDRQQVWTVIQAAMQQRQPFRLIYRINTASGAQKWVWEQGVGIFSPDGTIEALEGFITDITHRKEAEKKLKLECDKTQKYFAIANIMMLVIDKERKVSLINKKGLEILGREEDDVVGRDWLEFLPRRIRPDVDIAFRKFFMDGDFPQYYENYVLDANGKERLIAWNNTVLYDENGNVEATLSSGEDITKRNHDEMELIRVNEELKEHNRLKDEFISIVSHEMRTPLCVFKNILSNALAGALGAISQKLRTNLETANQNIDRLARIVNDFLDMAKMESGKMQLRLAMVDMQRLIHEIVETFTPITTQRNIHFDMLLPNTPIAIEADRDKLVQIFTNLVGNSIKFTPDGGQILVTLSDYDNRISAAIHDTGKGISPQHLGKIFNRFETGATSTNSGQPSTGLGLNIAKELVELHHGQIRVKSVVGQGSTFTFTLPKKQPA
jgi:hypothetical protein